MDSVHSIGERAVRDSHPSPQSTTGESPRHSRAIDLPTKRRLPEAVNRHTGMGTDYLLTRYQRFSAPATRNPSSQTASNTTAMIHNTWRAKPAPAKIKINNKTSNIRATSRSPNASLCAEPLAATRTDGRVTPPIHGHAPVHFPPRRWSRCSLEQPSKTADCLVYTVRGRWPIVVLSLDFVPNSSSADVRVTPPTRGALDGLPLPHQDPRAPTEGQSPDWVILPANPVSTLELWPIKSELRW